jgi:hypothetical protein
MNWLIPSYYDNTEYKNVKCRHCGIEVILNPKIKSENDRIKPVNLDHSSHNCCKLYQKRSSWL